MPRSAVEVSELVVRYGTRVAVDGVSFSGRAGRVLALLGPNGAGKTSTVETLEGYRRPAAGTVRVLGLDPVGDHRKVVARMGVMLQEGGVYPGMTAEAALRLFASFYGDPIAPDSLITRLGLAGAASTTWRRLSGGERQRLSLALALVGRPEVVFLDEPTAGVDPEGRVVVRQVVDELRSDGVAVVMTTHELEEAERLADDVVLLNRGRVALAGETESLRRAPGTVRFRAAPGIDVASLSHAVGADVTEERPGEYVLGGAATSDAVAAVTAWLAENDLVIEELRTGLTLEDVFLAAVREGQA